MGFGWDCEIWCYWLQRRVKIRQEKNSLIGGEKKFESIDSNMENDINRHT